MSDDTETLSDAFNDIFALQLKWGEIQHSENELLISRPELDEMHRLCTIIANKLNDYKIQNAIWILTQTRGIVPASLIEPNLMENLNFSEKEKAEIKKSVHRKQQSNYYFIDEERIYKNLRNHQNYSDLLHPNYPIFRDISKLEYIRIMNMFFRAEENILRKTGLNQNSISIIMNELRERQDAIRINLARKSSVYMNRYLRSIESLKAFSNTVAGIAGRMRERRAGYVDLKHVRSLARSKEKLIGLATLWGDAVPLLISQDWGIAGVISTTAGATVAAVLPTSPIGD